MSRNPGQTARTGRQAYELAIQLAADLTPGARGTRDMPERVRREKLEAAHLWAEIAAAHAMLAVRDKLTEFCRLVAKDMRSRGVLSEFEERVSVSRDDMREAGIDPDDERTWGRGDDDDDDASADYSEPEPPASTDVDEQEAEAES